MLKYYDMHTHALIYITMITYFISSASLTTLIALTQFYQNKIEHNSGDYRPSYLKDGEDMNMIWLYVQNVVGLIIGICELSILLRIK